MFCENHRCIDPESIKCRKTIEYGACGGENEWVAGFVERKNETNEWLEVECCHSTITDNFQPPAFVKNIAESGTYYHEILVENGTLISMDYVKDIKKIKNVNGQIIYTASIYRMKCSEFNSTNIPSIFDSAESLIDEDGIGKFEDYPKICNNDSDVHVTNINSWDGNQAWRTCFSRKCLKHVSCKKNVKIEDCVKINQWVADFTKVENNETLFEVECCQYFDDVNATFMEYANFTKTDIKIEDTVFESNIEEMRYINNITVDESFENGQNS
uniref:Uncharacterized protein n=1 Tax=Panagrolaimus sp. ES5 TaxID=591445 RepID=A0AC34FE93_9BILA